jgi:hypothetical protein
MPPRLNKGLVLLALAPIYMVHRLQEQLVHLEQEVVSGIVLLELALAQQATELLRSLAQREATALLIVLHQALEVLAAWLEE